ncbi:MAG: DUF2318 domain-containing protein [Helicobacteraceae bacterium]|jgi:uncharacterized membrane protein|nr:DUF2318 domain-containing protein [Helicobacteraceae bacterium]
MKKKANRAALTAVFMACALSLMADGRTAENDDLVIQIKDVSESGRFYPISVDGMKMEVIAIRASDGTVRTAFNACRVCYSSGRGYYKMDQGVLVCQNCGNRFGAESVETQSGGCSPVPIFGDDKSVTNDTIVISRGYLRRAKTLFDGWKAEYE